MICPDCTDAEGRRASSWKQWRSFGCVATIGSGLLFFLISSFSGYVLGWGDDDIVLNAAATWLLACTIAGGIVFLVAAIKDARGPL